MEGVCILIFFADRFENVQFLHVILAHTSVQLFIKHFCNEGSWHALERMNPLRVIDLLEGDKNQLKGLASLIHFLSSGCLVVFS